MIKICMIIASIIFSAYPYVLITSLYNETNAERQAEYIACMQKNIDHTGIEHIHVFYDTSNHEQSDTQPIFDILQAHPKISWEPVTGRPTFGQAFAYANEHWQEHVIIIANADIYFNKTLHLLDTYDFTNKFLALTRWDVDAHGNVKEPRHNDAIVPWKRKRKRKPLSKYKLVHKPNTCSQDTWIFKTPFNVLDDCEVCLGAQHCDGMIAYQAKLAGLTVLNPCLSLQSCHLHQSGIRHYVAENAPPERSIIKWSELF